MVRIELETGGRWVVKAMGVAEPESQADKPMTATATATATVTATTFLRRVWARRLRATAKASMMEAPMAGNDDPLRVVLFTEDSTDQAAHERNALDVLEKSLLDALLVGVKKTAPGQVVVVERTMQADPGKDGTIGSFPITLATQRFTTLPPLIVTENDAGPSLSDLIIEARR